MCCAFSPSGTFIASGGLDNLCSIFNLVDQKPLRELEGHSAFVSCCRFLSDTQIVTTSDDTDCILWDIENHKKLREFTDHQQGVNSLSLSKDTKTFISGSSDGYTNLYDLGSGDVIRNLVHNSDINALHHFPNETAFIAGCDDGSAHLFDLKAGRTIQTYKAGDEAGAVRCVSFSMSGRFFFAGYDDNSCRVFDTVKGSVAYKLDSHDNRVSTLGVNMDGSALATGSWDHILQVWA